MKLETVLILFFVALALLAGVKLLNLDTNMPLYQQSASSGDNGLSNPFSISRINDSQPIGNTSLTQVSELASALNADNESVALVDYIAPVCGDDICDADETCSTCSDCACSANQTCSGFGVCVANESCGDSVCTNAERSSRSCCTDCGCGANTLCNQNILACLPLAQLTPAKLNQSIQAALQLPGYGNYTYAGAYDDYYTDKVVKTIVLRCPGNPQFHCEAYVYVDASGTIVGSEHTV